MTNLLKALLNLQTYADNDLNKITKLSRGIYGGIRINKVGDPLELFVKDMFCNSFRLSPQQKATAYASIFSHQGSQNNPPDAMILNGDALEIKKVEGFNGSTIALNSSFPRVKIFSTDPMISDECRNCENWTEKEVIYSVGHQEQNKVKALIFVFGNCFAADAQIYENIKSKIIEGVSKLGLSLSKTKEVGRLNKIDPLQITDMRIRGMFQIKSPIKYFSNFVKIETNKKLSVFAIMRKSKFDSFSKAEQKLVLSKMNVSNIKLKEPNNPSKNFEAVLISYNF